MLYGQVLTAFFPENLAKTLHVFLVQLSIALGIKANLIKINLGNALKFQTPFIC
jgi:hypothetical protein